MVHPISPATKHADAAITIFFILEDLLSPIKGIFLRILLLCIILLDRAGKIRRVPQAAAIGVIPAAAETHAAGVAEDADTDANANEETPQNAGEASAEPAAPVKPDDSDSSDDSKGDA